MALYDTTHSTFGGAGLAARMSAPILRAYAAVLRWNDVRVTRNALSALTDRELDDIGLTRGDLSDIAAHLSR